LINLIVVFDSDFEIFRNRGYLFPPNLFYYHEISVPEVIGVLISKFKFTNNEAKNALSKLIEMFKLVKIARVAELDNPFEALALQANRAIAIKDKTLAIGIQDQIIIGGFLRNKINIIHSGDKGFIKTCEKLKINTISIPTRDIQKEIEIKKILKKR
jgi:hypothetical protein